MFLLFVNTIVFLRESIFYAKNLVGGQYFPLFFKFKVDSQYIGQSSTYSLHNCLLKSKCSIFLSLTYTNLDMEQNHVNMALYFDCCYPLGKLIAERRNGQEQFCFLQKQVVGQNPTMRGLYTQNHSQENPCKSIYSGFQYKQTCYANFLVPKPKLC